MFSLSWWVFGLLVVKSSCLFWLNWWLKTIMNENSPPQGDCGLSEGIASPPPQGSCLREKHKVWRSVYEHTLCMWVRKQKHKHSSPSNPPLRACFLVVLRQQWPRPGTGLMSLLLTGGGWSTSLGGRVRQTGSPAALIRIPVMPRNSQQRGDVRHRIWGFRLHERFIMMNSLSR